MKTVNIVLYTRDGAARQPLASYDPSDAMLVAKIAGEVGAHIQHCKKSGATAGEFVVVRETREANEQGIVIGANFEQLDASCSKVLSKAGTVDALFAELAKPRVAAPAPETPQQQAETKARKRSNELSR